MSSDVSMTESDRVASRVSPAAAGSALAFTTLSRWGETVAGVSR